MYNFLAKIEWFEEGFSVSYRVVLGVQSLENACCFWWW